MKDSKLLLLVAFLLVSGMVMTEVAQAKPSEQNTETKVPVSPILRQSSEQFSTPATYNPPNTQSNEQPLCFYQNSDGTIVDLSKLCGAKSSETVSSPQLRNSPISPINDGKTPPYW